MHSPLTRLSAQDRKRNFYDRMQRYLVLFGGVSVLFMLILLVIYLTLSVAPLFQNATLNLLGQAKLTTSDLNNQIKNEIISQQRQPKELSPNFTNAYQVHLSNDGASIYLLSKQGSITAWSLPFDTTKAPNQVKFKRISDSIQVMDRPVAFMQGSATSTWYAYADQKGNIQPFQITDNDKKINQEAFQQDKVQLALNDLADFGFQISNTKKLFIARNEQGEWAAKLWISTEQDSERSSRWKEQQIVLPHLDKHPDWYQVSEQGEKLYVLSNGFLNIYQLTQQLHQYQFHLREQVDVRQNIAVSDDESFMVAPIKAELLSGGYSLILSYPNGEVQQWFDVREGASRKIQHIRTIFHPFKPQDEEISYLTLPSGGDKSLYRITQTGQLDLVQSTTQEYLIKNKKLDAPVQLAGLSKQGDFLLVVYQQNWQLFRVNKPHLGVSWHSLWSPIWYEGYDKSAYIWQPITTSSASEPKYSLVPIVFGTLKAALVAILFATPIALSSAIYTAYFMAPKVRALVKPTIELMEALPSVILGFIAAIWFAPFVETHLLASLLTLVGLPISFLFAACLWRLLNHFISPNSYLNQYLQMPVIQSWLGILLLPFTAGVIFLLFHYAQGLELWLFDGDFQSYLSSHGIHYVQKNTLIVGFAMGLAVIPSIFTIVEDAVFSVPKHLCDGASALGATPWQSLMTVILPTASAGIFSAIMIGFGRAIGETMIVLMATGNTPVMNSNVFEGLRSLAANIAIEMPESDVGSSHFRVLILAALFLFGFTFILNAVAEMIRQRLRAKYKAL